MFLSKVSAALFIIIITAFYPGPGNSSAVFDSGELQQKLEEALFNDTKNLYRLQRAFFPPDGTSPVRVDIIVATTVKKIEDINGCNSLQDCEGFYYNCDPSRRDHNPVCSALLVYCGPTYCWVRSLFWDSETPCIVSTINSTLICLTDSFTWTDLTHAGSLTYFINSTSMSTILSFVDPVVTWFLRTLSTGFSKAETNEIRNVSVELHLDYLSGMPCDGEVIDALRVLLMWAKAYARNIAKPIEKSENDRGVVDCQFSDNEHVVGCSLDLDYVSGTMHLDGDQLQGQTLVLIIYCTLNIAIVIVVYLFLGGVINVLLSNPQERTRKLYWLTVFLVAILNLFLQSADVFMYVQYQNRLSRLSDVSAVTTRDWALDLALLIAKPILGFIVLLFEPFIAWFATKTIRIPVDTKVFNVLCCCCFCCCGRCPKSRLVHTLSLCHILWFVHRLASGAIVSVFFIIESPAQTTAALSLLFLAFMCTILMLYYALSSSAAAENGSVLRKSLHTFCIVFAGLLFLTLIVSISLLYLDLLRFGMNYSTVGGVALSLIPSGLIFVLSLFIKKRFTAQNLGDEQQEIKRAGATPHQSHSREGADQPVTSVHNNTMPELEEPAIRFRNIQRANENTPLLPQ